MESVARGTGRSLAWICGEEEARPVIGTANHNGRITMTQGKITTGLVEFVSPSRYFGAGVRVFVDECSTWLDDEWLVMSAPGEEPFFAWAYRSGGLQMLRRADDEVVLYQPARHTISGVVIGVLGKAPKPSGE